jgi:hypothetical protein
MLRLIMISISLVIGLGVAEVMARVMFPISDGRDNVTLDGKPIKGWFTPNSVYRQVTSEYDARTTITDKAHRVPGVASGSPDVIFLGDSFTYGYGLTDEQTFASLYCQARHVTCANLGIPGSGTKKQVERLEEFLDKYQWKPRELKFFFFGMSGSFSAGNDFVDNYDREIYDRTPPAERGARRQRADRGFVERAIEWQGFLLNHSALMRVAKYQWGPAIKSMVVAAPGDERMATALEATRRNLAQLDDLSRSRGFAYTIYLIVPVQDIIRGSYGDTLRTLNSVSPKPAVPTAELYLSSPKSFYYAFDGHLNPAGSNKLAQFLIAQDNVRAAR